MPEVKQIELNDSTYPAKDVSARESAAKALGNEADAFSASSSYAAGDLVLYEGVLYKFTASHSGAWNAAHASVVTIDDLIAAEAAARTKLPFVTADNGNRNAGFHNSIFRGKSLGTAVSSAQWTQIGAGTFDDLFIGDYWTINSIVWRIAGFDYWYRCGDTECTTHHIVIVPDSNLLVADGTSTHWLHISNTTENGYVGTDFYAGTNSNTGKAECKTKAQNAFGSSHILNHREYLTNSCKSGNNNVGYPTSGGWYDSDVEIMNEQMVYGCKVFGSRSAGANLPADYTIGKSQLPLFALAPQYICNRAHWWLRDPASAAGFAGVYADGNCNYVHASNAVVGVRPAFGIKA